MAKDTIIEVGGVKLAVDMRYAKRIDELHIGDRVKVLTKQSYQKTFDVHPGIVVGFEPFQKLPTIVIAYIADSFSTAEVKFLHYNSQVEDTEIVAAADEDFHVDRDAILARFERLISAKQREIETLEEQVRYFETNFRAYWAKIEGKEDA